MDAVKRAKKGRRKTEWLSLAAESIINGANILATVSLIIMLVINFVTVLWRYLLGNPLYWGDEVMIYMMVIMVYAGFGIVLTEGGHIRVTVLFGRLPLNIRNILWIIVSFLGTLYSSYLLYAVVRLVMDSIHIRAFSQVTRWPLAPWQIAIAFGLFALVVAFIQVMAKRIGIALGVTLKKKTEETLEVKD